jgi:dTDP-4-dehydrorhamnose 3,5-epimerase
METRLTPEAEAALAFQSYDPAPEIHGVWARALRKHRSIEGSFMEYLRLTEGRLEGVEGEFTVRQVSVSAAAPDRINAFHIHPKEIQDEIWCVVRGEMLVWLVDVRSGSPTVGVRRAYTLSGEAPALLHIPSGVAHGYKAGTDGALLLYTMNSQFSITDPNEGRLPWDFFGTELWEPDRG